MSNLKKVIKEAVREAIQEELKDILLEAVKTPKVITAAPPQQIKVEEQKVTPQQPQMSMEEKRQSYQNILGETQQGLQFNSSHAQTFRPNPSMGTEGALPPGEVGMNQIMGLMNKK